MLISSRVKLRPHPPSPSGTSFISVAATNQRRAAHGSRTGSVDDWLITFKAQNVKRDEGDVRTSGLLTTWWCSRTRERRCRWTGRRSEPRCCCSWTLEPAAEGWLSPDASDTMSITRHVIIIHHNVVLYSFLYSFSWFSQQLYSLLYCLIVWSVYSIKPVIREWADDFGWGRKILTSVQSYSIFFSINQYIKFWDWYWYQGVK